MKHSSHSCTRSSPRKRCKLCRQRSSLCSLCTRRTVRLLRTVRLRTVRLLRTVRPRSLRRLLGSLARRTARRTPQDFLCRKRKTFPG